VAKGASADCRALVFGFNTFLALIFQTILTLIVASDRGLALPIRTQVSFGNPLARPNKDTSTPFRNLQFTLFVRNAEFYFISLS